MRRCSSRASRLDTCAGDWPIARAAGVPLMTGGLGAYLATGAHSAPFIIAGSLLVIAGMALFLAVLVADLRRARRTTPALRPAVA